MLDRQEQILKELARIGALKNISNEEIKDKLVGYIDKILAKKES